MSIKNNKTDKQKFSKVIYKRKSRGRRGIYSVSELPNSAYMILSAKMLSMKEETVIGSCDH